MQVTEAAGAAQEALGGAARATETLSEDFDAFLELLTTQVTNQDPLEPLDSTQFVEQLATFSALEQQVATNSHLETITGLIRGGLGGESQQLLGQTIRADAVVAQGPFPPVEITAPSGVEGRLVVTNAAGDRVFTDTGAEASSSWSWDGRTVAGANVPRGTYQFFIETAGGALEPAAVRGTVDRVIETGSGLEAGIGPGITAARYEKV